MKFYPGLHQPSDAKRFARCCISINRLIGHRTRAKPLGCGDVLIDSGAFTELTQHGRYRAGVQPYARELRRLHDAGIARITAAVAQDYMCEPFVLAKTGLSVEEHQRLTIKRYDQLVACRLPFRIMPVIQGYEPEEYARHVRAYGARLKPGAWVGVGSVCKRNASPAAILAVLDAILTVRPDLGLHGFGLKFTALRSREVRSLLDSADSMAWSFAARRQGRDRNSWQEAARFAAQIG